MSEYGPWRLHKKDEDILEGLLSLYSSELGRATSLLLSTIPERLR